MKKFVTTIALIAVLAVSGACSGSDDDSSARGLYADYTQKYGYVADAFGTDLSETFEEYAADLDDCIPLDGEATVMITALVGATLTEHGDDVATFVKDTNALLAAVDAEGLCGTDPASASTPTTIPPTTTTTIDTSALTAELESKCWDSWNSLNDLQSDWYALRGYNTVEWKSQGREIQGLYRSGAAACEGILPKGTTDSMLQIASLVGEQIDLF